MGFLSDSTFATYRTGLGIFASLAISFVFGIAVLCVYVVSNRHKRLDTSLTEVIPLLTLLMSVMMHIDSSIQAVTFFGIFGVLSIVRFRSSLTDQKGITFILFSVIMGILVGAGQYALSVLAFVVLSGVVLAVPRALPVREFFVLRCLFEDAHVEKKRAIEAFLSARGLRYKPVSIRGTSSNGTSGKRGRKRYVIEFEIRRPRTTDMVELYVLFDQFAMGVGVDIEIREII